MRKEFLCGFGRLTFLVIFKLLRRLILNRFQTKDELTKQNVLSWQHNLVCPLCLGSEESHQYLFFFCPIVVSIFDNIYGWLNLTLEIDNLSQKDHLLLFKKLLKEKSCKKKFKNFRLLCWMFTSWAICLVCNDILFKDEIKRVTDIVLLSKQLS